MPLRFIDHPKYFDITEYQNTIKKITTSLSSFDSVISIYQIGSVSTPGISDIDLLIIFEDNIKISINPRNNLNKTELYLLVHNCFGTSESFFKEAQNFSFFHNYKLLYGKNLLSKQNIGPNSRLKIQIALEYMLKMYITLTVQLSYGIIKLRSILLEIKAILYDLEFLDITDSKLNNLVNHFIEIRNNWFIKEINIELQKKKIIEFYLELEDFLGHQLNELSLYTKNNKIRFTNNISIVKSQKLNYKSNIKIKLLNFIPTNKKIFNLMNKFNSFIFYVPIQNTIDSPMIKSYFDYTSEVKMYNKIYLPNFSPLISSFISK